jgi:hypothetical protein
VQDSSPFYGRIGGVEALTAVDLAPSASLTAERMAHMKTTDRLNLQVLLIAGAAILAVSEIAQAAP